MNRYLNENLFVEKLIKFSFASILAFSSTLSMAGMPERVDSCFNNNSDLHAALRCSQKVIASGVERNRASQNPIVTSGQYNCGGGMAITQILVVGSELRMSWNNGVNYLFECGALECVNSTDSDFRLQLFSASSFKIEPSGFNCSKMN